LDFPALKGFNQQQIQIIVHVLKFSNKEKKTAVPCTKYLETF